MSHSAACCTVPPVQTGDYNVKGKFITVDGLKTYVTGDSSAKHAIFVIYDIFGFYPQTLQGSDILAYGDKERPVQVFMPDLFDGKAADIAWYPPDNEEKGKKLGAFLGTTANQPKNAELVSQLLAQLKKDNPNLTTWGVVGYCWGGKIVNLLAREGTPFKAAAICHPAFIVPEDGPQVTIPIAVLPSKDEDKETITKYQEGLKVKNVLEWFPDQFHGWMAARADLANDRVKHEYERGYKILLDFFHEHLSGSSKI